MYLAHGVLESESAVLYCGLERSQDARWVGKFPVTQETTCAVLVCSKRLSRRQKRDSGEICLCAVDIDSIQSAIPQDSHPNHVLSHHQCTTWRYANPIGSSINAQTIDTRPLRPTSLPPVGINPICKCAVIITPVNASNVAPIL